MTKRRGWSPRASGTPKPGFRRSGTFCVLLCLVALPGCVPAGLFAGVCCLMCTAGAVWPGSDLTAGSSSLCLFAALLALAAAGGEAPGTEPGEPRRKRCKVPPCSVTSRRGLDAQAGARLGLCLTSKAPDIAQQGLCTDSICLRCSVTSLKVTRAPVPASHWLVTNVDVRTVKLGKPNPEVID